MRNVAESISTSTNHLHILKFLDFLLRLSVIPLSAASIWVTVTSNQDNSIYGKLQYSNLSGLKYMVCINAISTAYALVAVSLSWVRCLITKVWVLFVSDQVVAYLMVTAGAAVVEILYLAYNGDREVTWSEACSSYGKFCNRVRVALVLHGLALLCFFVLSLISACRLFSMFAPPCVPSEGVDEERD